MVVVRSANMVHGRCSLREHGEEGVAFAERTTTMSVAFAERTTTLGGRFDQGGADRVLAGLAGDLLALSIGDVKDVHDLI
ncbi:hypothetical protein UC8_49730 [Roseimaritima ulvae]|uniref:Uncharacterized protein n=1 Tax=Roseimaritima ulvae TaxID=980254 RepID=A0A5B9R839_9BACT|nr:hypothetical protein UC8_49730 [Roseimaritima ulvae]